MYKPRMAPAITGNNIASNTCTKNDKNAHVTKVNVIMVIVRKSKHSHGSMKSLRDLFVLCCFKPFMQTLTIRRTPQMIATPE